MCPLHHKENVYCVNQASVMLYCNFYLFTYICYYTEGKYKKGAFDLNHKYTIFSMKV